MRNFEKRYTIKEVAEKLNRSEDSILADLEDGSLAAMVLADITWPDGREEFNWYALPPEGVRRMLAGTHDEITWTSMIGAQMVARSNPDGIRVMTWREDAKSLIDALYLQPPVWAQEQAKQDWDAMTQEEKKASWCAMSPEGRREKAPDLMKNHGGNKTAAGREVGISANAMRRYLKESEEQSEAPLPVNKWTQAAGLVKPKQGKASR